MEKKYNLKSPAVKRLMREAVELKDPTHQYHAQPLEDNLFEWHFTVRGPPDTEFAGGLYHGRITLPAEYPMKPPSIILLTPNGRFEVGKKICLSMSAHHPETWQPSWSLRTVLLALIGFMPTKGAGAIGALDYTPDERKKLATRSNDWTCGACAFDHGTCLLEADLASNDDQQNHEAKELAAHINFKAEADKTKSNEQNTPATTSDQAQVDQSSGVENIQNNLNERETILRQRVTTTTSVEDVANDSHTANEQTNSNSPNTTADYLSLILLWIVAAVLVILILRRLASENSSLTKSSY